MGRAALSHAHRFLGLAQTLLTSLAQMNIPYAAEILLLQRCAEMIAMQLFVHGALARSTEPRQHNPNHSCQAEV